MRNISLFREFLPFIFKGVKRWKEKEEKKKGNRYASVAKKCVRQHVQIVKNDARVNA